MGTLSELKNVLLVLTSNCNLKCDYCYMKQRDEVMSFDIAKKVIDNIGNGVSLEFFGGEPLLYPELVSDIIDYAIESKKNIRPMIISNGTIFNDKVKEILDKNVSIGVSFDGLDNFHRSHSKDTDKIIINNIKAINAHIGRQIGVKTSITPYNIDNIVNNVKYLYEDEGINFISHFLLREDVWTKEALVKLENNLETLLEYYITQPNLNLDLFFVYLDTNKRTFGCWSGKHGVAIDYNGDLYPCQRFLTNHSFKLGTIDTGVKNMMFRHYDSRNFVGCNKCEVYDRCNDFCIASQYEYGTLFKPIPCSCEATKICFKVADKIRTDSKYNMIINKFYKRYGNN